MARRPWGPARVTVVRDRPSSLQRGRGHPLALTMCGLYKVTTLAPRGGWPARPRDGASRFDHGGTTTHDIGNHSDCTLPPPSAVAGGSGDRRGPEPGRRVRQLEEGVLGH